MLLLMATSLQLLMSSGMRTANSDSLLVRTSFYHSKALRTKTNSVQDGLQAQPDHPKHGEALAELVSELIEAGMDYYFLKTLKQARVGFVAEQSARLGMSGAVKLINSVSRNFIVRMDQAQLLVMASHVRSLARRVMTRERREGPQRRPPGQLEGIRAPRSPFRHWRRRSRGAGHRALPCRPERFQTIR